MRDLEKIDFTGSFVDALKRFAPVIGVNRPAAKEARLTHTEIYTHITFVCAYMRVHTTYSRYDTHHNCMRIGCAHKDGRIYAITRKLAPLRGEGSRMTMSTASTTTKTVGRFIGLRVARSRFVSLFPTHPVVDLCASPHKYSRALRSRASILQVKYVCNMQRTYWYNVYFSLKLDERTCEYMRWTWPGHQSTNLLSAFSLREAHTSQAWNAPARRERTKQNGMDLCTGTPAQFVMCTYCGAGAGFESSDRVPLHHK